MEGGERDLVFVERGSENIQDIRPGGEDQALGLRIVRANLDEGLDHGLHLRGQAALHLLVQLGILLSILVTLFVSEKKENSEIKRRNAISRNCSRHAKKAGEKNILYVSRFFARF